MTTRREILRTGVAAGGVALFGRSVFAEDKFPTRSIKFVVPFPPGGGVDVPARYIAEAMRPILGQSLVVENKVGANGMIGAQFTAAAPPDGYTIMMAGPNEIAIAPHLYKSMAYNPLTDLQPIMMCIIAPNVLCVGPATPAETVSELIALAKQKPGVLTCGSSGIGSIQHLNLELFNKLAGTKILHVPYKGVPPQNTDLMGGMINMGFSSVIGVLPLIKSGKLRAIAVTSLERVAVLPDVPTLSETPSLAGYDLNNWDGMLGPAGLPKPILKTLHDAAFQAMETPALLKQFRDGGAIPNPGTPEEYAAYIAAQSKKYGQIIKEMNITLAS